MGIFMRLRCFLLLVLMVCVVHPTQSGAQSGSPVFADQIGLAPLEKSGDFSVSFVPFLPPAKSLVVPKLNYNSGVGLTPIQLTGWYTDLPYIADTSGSYTYFDGASYYPLILTTTTNTYVTSRGDLFTRSTNGTFTTFSSDGTVLIFGTTTSGTFLGHGQLVALTEVRTRVGWNTTYSYNTDGLLTAAAVDGFIDPQSGATTAARFNITFTYLTVSGGKRLSAVNVVKGSTTLSGLTLTSSGATLQSIAEFGLQAQTIRTTTLIYNTNGLLQEIRDDELAGKTTFSYTNVALNSNTTKAVLQSVHSLNGTGADVTSNFTYANPMFAGGRYFGMAEVTHEHPDLTKTRYTYETTSGATFGLSTQVLHFFSGVSPITQQTVYYPITEESFSYITGGSNNELVALARTLKREYGTAGGQKTSAATYTTNFSALPMQMVGVVQHGLVDPASTLTTISEASMLQDNVAYTMEYYPGATSAPYVRNLLKTVEGKVPDGTVVSKLKYEYNASYDLSKQEQLVEGSTYRAVRTTYNALGQLVELTGPMGERTSYEYNGIFPKSMIRDPQGLNFKKSFVFNQDTGQLMSSTDENGRKLTYTYDNAFRPVTENAVSAVGTVTDTFGYNFGNVPGNNYASVQTVDTVNLLYVDGFGRPMQGRLDLENGGGRLVADTLYSASTGAVSTASAPYTSSGASFTSPAGTHTMQFNQVLGDLTSVVPSQSGNGIGSWQIKNESTDGMDPYFEQLQNPVGNVTGSTSSAGREDIFQGAGSEKIETRIDFDIKNILTQVSFQATHTFNLKFNRQSELREVDLPFTTPETLTYDASGRVQSRVAKEGDRIDYTYDGIGRPTQLKGYDKNGLLVDTITYTYDTAAKPGYLVIKGSALPAKIQSNVDTVYLSYTHDGSALSTLTQEKNGVAGSMRQFFYDHAADGKLERIVYPNGLNIEYSYDALGRIKKIFSPALTAIFPNGLISEILSRDERGSITAQNLGDGTAVTAQYAPNSGAMLHYLAMKGTTKIYEATFTYNNLKLIKIEESTATDARTIEMTEYNSRDELRRFEIDGNEYEITYDSFGRPTANGLLDRDWTYNDLSSNPNPYQPMTDAGNALGWNLNRQLVSKDVPNISVDMTMAYSPFGDLTQVSNQQGTLHYLWSGLGGVFEMDEFFNGVNYTTRTYGPKLYQLHRALDLTTNLADNWHKVTVLGEKPTLPFRKNDDIIAEFLYGDPISFESGTNAVIGSGGSTPPGGDPTEPPGDPAATPTATPRPGSCESCHGPGPVGTPYPYPFSTPIPAPGEATLAPSTHRFPVGGCRPTDIANASCILWDPIEPMDDTVNQPQDKTKSEYAYQGNCNEGVTTTAWGTRIDSNTGTITIKAGSCMSCHEVYSMFGPRLRDQYKNYSVFAPGVLDADDLAAELNESQKEGLQAALMTAALVPVAIVAVSASGAVVTAYSAYGAVGAYYVAFPQMVVLGEVAVGLTCAYVCPYDAIGVAFRPTLLSGTTGGGSSPKTGSRTPCKFVLSNSRIPRADPNAYEMTWKTPLFSQSSIKTIRTTQWPSKPAQIDVTMKSRNLFGGSSKFTVKGRLSSVGTDLYMDAATIDAPNIDPLSHELKNTFGPGVFRKGIVEFTDWAGSLGYKRVEINGLRVPESSTGAGAWHEFVIRTKVK
jgi:YD repeat-containing protein